MSKAAKLILGIVTLLPFIFLAIYLGIVMQFVREIILHRTTPEDFAFQMWPAFIYIGLLFVVRLALLVFYIYHAVKNQKIDSTERIVWILLFIFIGIVGFPIYWYLRIWKEDGGLKPTLQ